MRSFSLLGLVLHLSRVFVLLSAHDPVVFPSLPLLLLQVEEPDPANHTDTRNPAAHAEKKGVYILLAGVRIFAKALLFLRHFPKQLSFCSQDTTEPMETHFLLADNVYCKASVPPTDKVCLWLGVSPTQFQFCRSISVNSEVCLWDRLFYSY